MVTRLITAVISLILPVISRTFSALCTTEPFSAGLPSTSLSEVSSSCTCSMALFIPSIMVSIPCSGVPMTYSPFFRYSGFFVSTGVILTNFSPMTPFIAVEIFASFGILISGWILSSTRAPSPSVVSSFTVPASTPAKRTLAPGFRPMTCVNPT